MDYITTKNIFSSKDHIKDGRRYCKIDNPRTHMPHITSQQKIDNPANEWARDLNGYFTNDPNSQETSEKVLNLFSHQGNASLKNKYCYGLGEWLKKKKKPHNTFLGKRQRSWNSAWRGSIHWYSYFAQLFGEWTFDPVVPLMRTHPQYNAHVGQDDLGNNVPDASIHNRQELETERSPAVNKWGYIPHDFGGEQTATTY